MARISIFHIGLPMDHPSIPEKIRPIVTQALEDLRAQMTAAGLHYHLVFYSPETGLEGFTEQLKTQACDGVIIGGGVVKNPAMSYFMEQIVDVTHKNAPRAKIMFIHDPEDVQATINRWFINQDEAQ